MNKVVRIALYAIAAPPSFVGGVMGAGALLAFVSLVFSAIGSFLSGFGSAMYWLAEYLFMIPALSLIAGTMQILGLWFFAWVIVAVVALIVMQITKPNKTPHG